MKTRLLLALYAAAITAPISSAYAGLIGNSYGFDGILDINTTTGTASNPRGTGVGTLITGIAFDPFSGILFGLTAFNGSTPNSLVKINPITGAATLVGATGLSNIFEGDLAVNPLNGRLYGIQDVPSGSVRNLFEINPLTGAAITIGSLASSGDFSALAFNAAGTLFTVDTANETLSTVNPATAALLTSVTMNVNLAAAAALTFDPMTGTAYLADGTFDGTKMLYTLDVGTGVATVVGPLGNLEGMTGLAFVVPEPGAIPFCLMGVCACGMLSRRRRR